LGCRRKSGKLDSSNFGFPRYRIPESMNKNGRDLEGFRSLCLVGHRKKHYICAVSEKGGEYMVIDESTSGRDVYDMQTEEGIARILNTARRKRRKEQPSARGTMSEGDSAMDNWFPGMS
jgi:hypothetical protein